jgi:EpsI family protein
MMFGVERVILWARRLAGRPDVADQLFQDVRRGPEDERQASNLFHAAASPRGWATVVVLALSAGGAMWLNQSIPSIWDQNIARQALPEALMIDGKEWRSHDYELDNDTLDMLETRDYLGRQYFRSDAPSVEFSIVFSKDNRKGTHPPELCLEKLIVAKEVLTVAAVAGHVDMEWRELTLQYPATRACCVYIYKCGDRYTRSFWKQQFMILWNGLTKRDASGALIRLITPIVNNDVQAARERISEFVRVAVPYLDAGLR